MPQQSNLQKLQQSLKNIEEKQGSDHPEVAEVLDQLGIECESLGDYAEAERFYRRALAILKKSVWAFNGRGCSDPQ